MGTDRVPAIGSAGSRSVPINAAQLGCRHGAVLVRAISQQGSELRHATRTGRHRIRDASRASVESYAGQADGNGASVFLSLSAIPRFLPAATVERILECCDQTTSVGRRNHAILLLLARLGVRAGEVGGLSLDDIDWSTGQITPV